MIPMAEAADSLLIAFDPSDRTTECAPGGKGAGF